MEEAIAWALSDYKPDLKHDLSSNKQVKQVSQPRINNSALDDETCMSAALAVIGLDLTRTDETPVEHATLADIPQQDQKFQKKLEKKQAAGENGQGKQKPTRLEFFQIALPTDRVTAILEAVFSNADADTKRFYTQLKNTRRIQQAFHITLIHRSSMTQHADYWNGMSTLWTRKQFEALALQDGTNGTGTTAASSDPSAVKNPVKDLELGKAKVQLERVVWDDRVLAILARLPEADQNGFKTTNVMAHVTIGTAGEHIKPRESNDLLEGWERGTRTAKDLRINGSVVLEGIVRGVVSR